LKGKNTLKHRFWFYPTENKRILFHAINHIGLGHLNRQMAVAEWLKLGIDDVQFLFLIEGAKELIEPTEFQWIEVPGQQNESELEYCGQITRNVLNHFRPNLIVHDTLIRKPIYKAAKDVGVKQALVGRAGGILREQFQQNPSMMSEIDLLLLPHYRQELTASDHDLFTSSVRKSVYTGPIIRRQGQVSGYDVRQRLGLTAEQKVILVTFGGGGWTLANELLTSVLAARAEILAAYPQTRLVVITGPHFSGALPEKDEFVCYVSKFELLITDYLNVASVVVCMAGYNTVNEIAATGTPAICVPPSLEADEFVGRPGSYMRRFPHMVQGSTDSAFLARQICEALSQEQDPTAVQAFWQRARTAAQTMVDAIKELLEETHSERQAE
jgi:UDP-N-acetylglucosamine--N-acetylmuramyl-(pentapeptide) pyrophosphoryl-undecaprenol N-acetylglucosamine transferase